MDDMANEIRRARKILRMNQAQFAEALGASQGSVSKWEAGKEVPRLDTIQKIAELVPAFRVTGEESVVFRHDAAYAERRQMIPLTAMMRGSFLDGHEPTEEPDLGEISVLLDEGWKNHVLDAWGLLARHEQPSRRLTDQVGIFARLGPSDGLVDAATEDQFLVLFRRPEKSTYRLSLMSLVRGPQKELILWPSVQRGRARARCVELNDDGLPTSSDFAIVGILIALVCYPSRTAPTMLEPK